jgi:hypothetical protein
MILGGGGNRARDIVSRPEPSNRTKHAKSESAPHRLGRCRPTTRAAAAGTRGMAESGSPPSRSDPPRGRRRTPWRGRPAEPRRRAFALACAAESSRRAHPRHAGDLASLGRSAPRAHPHRCRSPIAARPPVERPLRCRSSIAARSARRAIHTRYRISHRPRGPAGVPLRRRARRARRATARTFRAPARVSPLGVERLELRAACLALLLAFLRLGRAPRATTSSSHNLLEPQPPRATTSSSHNLLEPQPPRATACVPRDRGRAAR